MRIPVPTNKIVVFALAGMLLTGLVAGGLAFPGAITDILPRGIDQAVGSAGGAASASSHQAVETRTPPQRNENFTPAVETRVVSEQPVSSQQTAPPVATPTATVQAPTPNPDFTPAVKTQSRSGYEEEEHEDEHEEAHEDEYED